jgi:hypothetical protein
MYSIAIDKGITAVTDLDEAKTAVAGTAITVVEADGIEGMWLAELPKDIADEMRHLGSFELRNGEYAVWGDYS